MRKEEVDINQVDDLTKRAKAVRQTQAELEEELLSIAAWLARFIDDTNSVNTRLKNILAESQEAKPKGIRKAVSDEDFKIHLEKLVQGSLDALGDKISDRVLNMLKELKGMTGPGRETKIREIKDAAESELVDLSRLFLHEKIESNIEEIGIDEKESKGIDKSLRHLRRMRGGRPESPPAKGEKDKDK